MNEITLIMIVAIIAIVIVSIVGVYIQIKLANKFAESEQNDDL